MTTKAAELAALLRARARRRRPFAKAIWLDPEADEDEEFAPERAPKESPDDDSDR